MWGSTPRAESPCCRCSWRTSPRWPDLARSSTLSEYLTAPLFVLPHRCRRRAREETRSHRFRANQVRAVALVVLGLVLTQFPSGIVVVLVWLGFMTLFATWMAALPTLALGGLGVAALVLEPILLRESTEWLVTHPADSITRAAVELTLNGGVVPAAWRWSCRPVSGSCSSGSRCRQPPATRQRPARLTVALVLFALDQTGDGARSCPTPGTRQELVFSSALGAGRHGVGLGDGAASLCPAWPGPRGARCRGAVRLHGSDPG